MEFSDKQINMLLHLMSYTGNDKTEFIRYINSMFGKEYSTKEVSKLLEEIRTIINIRRFK